MRRGENEGANSLSVCDFACHAMNAYINFRRSAYMIVREAYSRRQR